MFLCTSVPADMVGGFQRLGARYLVEGVLCTTAVDGTSGLQRGVYCWETVELPSQSDRALQIPSVIRLCRAVTSASNTLSDSSAAIDESAPNAPSRVVGRLEKNRERGKWGELQQLMCSACSESLLYFVTQNNEGDATDNTDKRRCAKRSDAAAMRAVLRLMVSEIEHHCRGSRHKKERSHLGLPGLSRLTAKDAAVHAAPEAIDADSSPTSLVHIGGVGVVAKQGRLPLDLMFGSEDSSVATTRATAACRVPFWAAGRAGSQGRVKPYLIADRRKRSRGGTDADDEQQLVNGPIASHLVDGSKYQIGFADE